MGEDLEKVAHVSTASESKGALLATLQAELEPEEVVLWAEHIVVDKGKFMFLRVVALAAMVLLFIITSSFFYGVHQVSINNVLIEIAFAVGAIYFAKQFFDIQTWQMRTRIAVLTNMRALECDGSGGTTIIWYSAPNFGKVQAVQTSVDLGDLLFATDEDSNRFGFRNVRNTAAAAEILFRAQSIAKEGKPSGN